MTACTDLVGEEPYLDIRVEVTDLAPEDPRITALLTLLFPDPGSDVSSACYPRDEVA